MKPGTEGPRILRIGLVASEVFDVQVGNLGGFGKAAAEFSRLTTRRPELGWKTLWILPRRLPGDPGREMIHGSEVLPMRGSLSSFIAALRRARLDVLLFIDLQSVFRIPFWALPRTPALFWIRDPWSPEDKRTIASLQIPGQPGVPPQGLFTRDLRSFRWDIRIARALRRRMAWGVPSPFLASKIPPTYGAEPGPVCHLPNFGLRTEQSAPRAARPTVLCIGRLDPIKRPWLVFEIARHMPAVDFLMVGTTHLHGAGAWAPTPASPTPANVRIIPSALGGDQVNVFSSAWLLLNTSIHEGLPLTFQEALAYELPIVAALDPEGVVSRFGHCVGECGGDGLEAVPRFVAALTELLSDGGKRESLGKEGRAWVESVHHEEAFVGMFQSLCDSLVARS